MSSDYTNLHRAKMKKDDEFYTLYNDIVDGLRPWLPYLQGKTVLLPCDGKSKFYQYLTDNFNVLQLNKVISINIKGEKYVYDGEEYISIVENGTFQYSIKHEKYDVIITNPPYSIVREFYSYVCEKPFIFLGTVIQLLNKDLFDAVLDGTLYFSHMKTRWFVRPDSTKQDISNTCFISNIPSNNLKIKPIRHIPCDSFDMIDGTDIINIDSTRCIPPSYKGLMAVPISYLGFHDSKKYKIVGKLNKPIVNGKCKFTRILIEEV